MQGEAGRGYGHKNPKIGTKNTDLVKKSQKNTLRKHNEGDKTNDTSKIN